MVSVGLPGASWNVADPRRARVSKSKFEGFVNENQNSARHIFIKMQINKMLSVESKSTSDKHLRKARRNGTIDGFILI